MNTGPSKTCLDTHKCAYLKHPPVTYAYSKQKTLSFFDQHPSLMAAVASIARTRKLFAYEEGNPSVFIATKAKFIAPAPSGWRDVIIGPDGTECIIEEGLTVFAGDVVMPASGVHYIEYDVLGGR
jgi:hypothetical protein